MEEVKQKNLIFNSPLEIALRLLYIFNSTTIPLDIQRLVNYHYLLIHSGDIPDSPKSIHPSLPIRACETASNKSSGVETKLNSLGTQRLSTGKVF